MGIGDAPIPVDDSVPVNNPMPQSGDDALEHVAAKAKQQALSGDAKLAYAVRWLYENASGGPYPYPPP